MTSERAIEIHCQADIWIHLLSTTQLGSLSFISLERHSSSRCPRRSRSICNMTARVLLPTLRPLRGNPQRFNHPFLTLATTRHSSTSSASSPTHPCPSCGTPVPLASSPCPSCSTILPIPSGLSHHSILSLSTPIPRGTETSKSGLPSEFDIPAELSTLPAHGYDLDARDLRQRMLGRQRELHPDKFASRGDRVVQMARELSGRVNKAYDVLGNPLKRAEYIVSRSHPDRATAAHRAAPGVYPRLWVSVRHHV